MFFWICYGIMFVVMAIFAPYKVYGRKNIVKKQNYIIASNHRSNFDAILLDFVFRKKNIYLAKKELFKSKVSAFFLTKVFGAIAIDRTKGISISQMKEVLGAIKDKKNLGVFPEGTRKDFNENEDIKGGACYFALKTKTPIIPCYIAKKHRFFRKNQIIVGVPFELKEFYGEKIDKDVIDKADGILKSKIAELKAEYENFVKEKTIVKTLKKQVK